MDDTPRAFTRLLNYTLKGRKPPSGLDDNPGPPSRKRKRTVDTSVPQPLIPNKPSKTSNSLPDPPKILPSEPLSAFAARVDAALPVIGLARSRRDGGLEGEGARQTKMERKMQKMQRQWREDDRRRRERAEEEADVDMGEDGERDVSGKINTLRLVGDNSQANGKKKKKKNPKKNNRRKHQLAQSDLDDDDDDDPWAAVARKRAEHMANSTSTSTPKDRGLVGLHDVVLAPPQFSRVPRVKIGAAGPERRDGIPPSVPGLRRQGELSAARRDVVEGYRRMMRERRGEGEGGKG